MFNHSPMYVCDRCGWGQYHPMTYCVKCPGRLKRVEVQHPQRQYDGFCFKTEQDREQWLKDQGVNYIGEYPRIAREQKKAVLLARATEHLEDAKREASEKRIAFWEREIQRIQTGTP